NGLALEDLINLERLKDQKVLRELPPDKRGHLSYNSKEDVALYLEAWASVLERQITKEPIPRLALSS
ncbi:MAG: hypothetical protein KI790_05410, partial [Cyclobacteriaceae bacterium]|nr:hypothetical protein [Cyclobacteriaceae bacterium HetDA_MAG_MS6]